MLTHRPGAPREPRPPAFIEANTFAVIVLAAAATVAATQAAYVRQLEQLSTTTCTDTVSGAVEALVVPAGATCTARALVVAGTVTIETGATLQTGRSETCDSNNAERFSAGGRIAVAPGGALLVEGTDIVIGSDVSARNALAIVVLKTPCRGARGIVRGDITIEGAGAVTLLGFQVDGNVVVQRSGREGIEIGANGIGGTLRVEDSMVRGVRQPSTLAIHSNTVARGMVIVGNDVQGAFRPPFVGGNTITDGSLMCENNVPDPTNVDLDATVAENVVVSGQKLRQCADL
jgi:hypothetical protein